MAKFKLVKRSKEEAASKPAAAGSARTGAKVVKTKAGKGTPGSSAGRFIGKTSGMSVTKYQNKTLADNLKRHLSDEQLAADWRKEFPNARAEYTAETVRGVRSVYNRGKHGNDVPRTPTPEYIDGEAQPFRGEKSAAKRERAAEKAAPKKVLKKGKK